MGQHYPRWVRTNRRGRAKGGYWDWALVSMSPEIKPVPLLIGLGFCAHDLKVAGSTQTDAAVGHPSKILNPQLQGRSRLTDPCTVNPKLALTSTCVCMYME